jgi:nucleoside-diphosphate-sugar epimerase
LAEGVRVLRGALNDPPAELRSLTPDVVVHMWAMTEADAVLFLRLFRGRAGRAIVISSGDVYRAYGRLQRLEPAGPPDPIPLTEDAPLRESRYPYRGKDDAYDKILVENVMLGQSELPITILRYPAVYGPNDYHRFGKWIQAMDAGTTELKMQDDFGGWRWTHGFSQDVAESVVLAATDPRAAGRIYNVGERETPTWIERIEELGRAAGWNGRVVPVPAGELPEAERMPLDFAHHLAIDTRRARTELGYAEIVPREEALARTIAWERLSHVQ